MVENFSGRNDRIKTNVKKFFIRIKKWVKRNKKLALVLLGALFICAIAIIVIRVFVTNETNETNMLTESAQEVLGVEEEQIKEIVEIPIEKDKYPELNLFFAEYFAALAEGNKTVIISDRTEMDDLEWIKLLKKSEFIESYQNLVCYTKPGPYDNTYVCYVYFEVKFQDLDTLLPGLNTLYVIQQDDKFHVEYSSIEEAVERYLISISKQDDVLDLFRKVQVEYNDLVVSDSNVELYLTDFKEQIKIEIAKELASVNAAIAKEEEVKEVDVAETAYSGTDTEPAVEEVIIEMVKATTTVNVRKSDSKTAEKIGKVQKGDEMTCLETLNNGWSKILYENEEAYIKTDYLEAIELKVVKEGIAIDGTIVTTTDNVHVREEASINAESLGAALAGESFELLENLDNGWSKISFNGEEAYIKSEYLDS
jgi:hypothetical protein